MPAVTIDPDDDYVTLINVFTVDPERADELCSLLAQATDEAICQLPGFVSANFHVSLDREHVANYSQWRSKDDFDGLFRDPAAAEHMKRANAIAADVQPVLYELRRSFTAR